MPDYDIDPNFERRLAERLSTHSEQAVEPFDAVEIAHFAARRRPMQAQQGFGRLLPAPVLGVLLTAGLLVLLTVTAFAAGWLPLPPPIDSPSPSPTDAAVPTVPASPLPTVLPTDEPTAEPTPEPSVPTTPTPTPAESPTSEPTASPPPPAVAIIGEWRHLRDFPMGNGQFVVVRDMTAGGPGFVAVGLISDGAGNISGGRAWTSADGQAWTIVDSPAFAGAKLEVVVEHLGSLYAFGPIPTDDEDNPDMGAYNVWRSANGQDWGLLPQPVAFAEQAVLLGATSAGETLVAWGYRNVEDGDEIVVRPGIWSWTPTAGGDWQLADTLPSTWDIQRMAYGDGVLVAIGNNRAEAAPWRTIWFSTDEGRTWDAGDARFIDNPDVTVADIAVTVDPMPNDHTGGVYAVVGWQGRDEETFPFSLGTTYYRDWFVGGPLTGYLPYQWERIAAIPGGFLTIGSEYRFEITPCAPAPCRELIPVAARMWTASTIDTQWADGFGGLVWDEANAPNAALSYYDVVAVGTSGVVIVASDPDFDRSVWFAPLSIP